jgi:hypothetical protein
MMDLRSYLPVRSVDSYTPPNGMKIGSNVQEVCDGASHG